jgi:hypothetical protein
LKVDEKAEQNNMETPQATENKKPQADEDQE